MGVECSPIEWQERRIGDFGALDPEYIVFSCRNRAQKIEISRVSMDVLWKMTIRQIPNALTGKIRFRGQVSRAYKTTVIKH
jgi:hypothetical protein